MIILCGLEKSPCFSPHRMRDMLLSGIACTGHKLLVCIFNSLVSDRLSRAQIGAQFGPFCQIEAEGCLCTLYITNIRVKKKDIYILLIGININTNHCIVKLNVTLSL